MTMSDHESIATRQSLLVRLKDLGDQQSWREFFDTYWRLIHVTALKAGLTESEAEEGVQEVMIAAAKKMPEFAYEPSKDSLKGWLLAVTRWKIGDQFRKRQSAGIARESLIEPPNLIVLPGDDDSSRTRTVERVPDPHSPNLETIWDSEWRENVLRAALDRVKRSVNPAHYEMYYLHLVQGLSARDTARALGVSTAAVYVAKHRVGKLLARELKALNRA